MMNDMVKEGDMKGANDKRLVPELRFPEFKKDWGKNVLRAIIKTITPPKKLQTTEYHKKGIYPIIDQSKIFICGLSDDESALVNKKKEDVVIFGDHTCILKLANFSFIQGADGIKIFKSSNPSIVRTGYIYQYLKAFPIGLKEYKRHYSELKEIIVCYPYNIIEQQKIAECLSSIDEEISAIKEKVEQLKVHKKGLLQKLFPVVGKFVPEFRFPESEKEWGKNALKTIIKTITPPKKLQTTEYHKKGIYPIIDQSQSFICGFSDDELALVNKNKEYVVIFGDHTCILKLANFTFIQGADGIKIFKSSNPNIVRTDYIYQYLSAFPIGVKEYKRHYSELKEIIVCYSYSIIEQQKIAECLSSIDELISLYENKVILLEQHKKGLMQQLFPKL